MMLINKIRKMTEYKVKKTVDFPAENVGNHQMDSTYVCLSKLRMAGGGGEPLIVYSVGIGDQINFELDLLKRYEGQPIELYAFDPTPNSISYVESQNIPENFHFYPWAIANKDKKIDFALPQTDGWVSGTNADVKNDGRNLDFENKVIVQGRSLSSIMKELGHNHIDILKMDVEGTEFDIMEGTFDSNIQIDQLLLDHHEHMLRQNGRKKIKKLMEIIHKRYEIYYVDDDARAMSCINRKVLKDCG